MLNDSCVVMQSDFTPLKIKRLTLYLFLFMVTMKLNEVPRNKIREFQSH